MKGLAISELGGAILVALAVVFGVIIAFIMLIAIQLPFGKEAIASQSIEFVAANSESYAFTSALTHFLAGDRQFIERAAEIVAAGSLKNASSEDLASYLKNFIEPYEHDRLIIISINKDGKELFSFDNIERKCGDSLEGFCVDTSTIVDRAIISYGCGKGRKKIDDSLYTKDENKCRQPREICCIEDITQGPAGPAYNDPDVIACGTPTRTGAKKGVCDLPTAYGNCFTGRVRTEDADKDCEAHGRSLVCCSPLSDALVETGLASTAEFPIMYRDNFGKIEVTAG